jgi:hypothetical protein
MSDISADKRARAKAAAANAAVASHCAARRRARLAPSHNAAGALEVAMVPSFALIGPGTVLGFGSR